PRERRPQRRRRAAGGGPRGVPARPARALPRDTRRPRGRRALARAALKGAVRGADEVGVDAVPHYDPEMIEQYAARLYGRASLVRVGAAVAGVMTGAFFGAIPLTSLGEAWPIPHMFGFATLLVGAVLGGLIGFVVGDARATGYRLHAQAALCQLQAVRHSAAVARAVEAGRCAVLSAEASAAQ